MDPEQETPTKKKFSFVWDFNVGHLFVIFSLFLSAAGLYAHDESRLSVVENKVQAISEANLNGRVSANEARLNGVNDRLDAIKDALLEIHNELNVPRTRRTAQNRNSEEHDTEEKKPYRARPDTPLPGYKYPPPSTP